MEEESKSQKIFDTTVFSDYLKSKLISLFENVAGKKVLIADNDVISLLTMVLGKDQLQENGVKKIIPLSLAEEQQVDKDLGQIVFFIQPTIKAIKSICNVIEADMKNRKKRQDQDYCIIYWPQRTILCDEAIERMGLKACVEVRDFNFDLVPLDEDVLSYEMNHSFHDLYVKKDLNIYRYIAESIQKIQSVYGKIPNIFAKGDGSQIVMDILNQEVELNREINKEQQPEIETLIMMDRNIDLLTPQLYQMTYEAQIDENFGIEGNICKMQANLFDKNADGKIGLKLSGEISNIYKDVRNMHLNTVSSTLQGYYNMHKEANEEFSQKKKSMGMDELTLMTHKIKKLQQTKPDLEKHFSIIQHIVKTINSTRCMSFGKEQELQSEAILSYPDYNHKNISEYVDMQCAVGAPIDSTLRLLMLQSQIENGVKAKEYDRIRKSIINAYGFDKVVTLDNLASCGLLRKNDGSKNNFEKIREKFKLLNPEVNTQNPDDISYVFDGYAPIAGRLSEAVIARQSWKEFKDYINLVPGQMSVPQKYANTTKERPCIMIFMIGGITYSELSAFRYLGEKYNKEIIIATTQILNQKKLYNQIYEGQFDNTEIIKNGTMELLLASRSSSQDSTKQKEKKKEEKEKQKLDKKEQEKQKKLEKEREKQEKKDKEKAEKERKKQEKLDKEKKKNNEEEDGEEQNQSSLKENE